jgi:hypothetical protein
METFWKRDRSVDKLHYSTIEYQTKPKGQKKKRKVNGGEMDEKWWKRKRKVGERSDKEAVKERRRNATETEKKRLKFKRNEKETLRAFALTLNICTHTFRNQAEQTYIYIYICIPRHIPHGPGPSRNMPYHTMPHHAMPHHEAHTTPHHTIPYHTTPYHMRRYLKKKAQFPTARQNA